MVRSATRTVREATSWCESIIMSSLVRLDAALVTEIFWWELVVAAEPGGPPVKNTKAAATPASVATANTGTPTRRTGFLEVLGLE
jgi:hypothetical protein